jgi:hypothetical protein
VAYLALAQVLSEFGVGSIGWPHGTAERHFPPGEPDLLGSEVPTGPGMQTDPVEGDALGIELVVQEVERSLAIP